MTSRKADSNTLAPENGRVYKRIRRSLEYIDRTDVFNVSEPHEIKEGHIRGIIDREEYLRVICQALQDLGFSTAGKELEKKAKITAESPQAALLKDSIASGNWDTALHCITQLLADHSTTTDNTNNIAQTEARFLILEQKYLELLHNDNSSEAVKCLRTELTPLGVFQNRLHNLAAQLLLKPADAHINITETRKRLLSELRQRLPIGVMLPHRRLEQLLEIALSYQLERCPFLNDQSTRPSLFHDFALTGTEQLPSETTITLPFHKDEVWHCAFSHDGKRLATASKDGAVIVWLIPAVSSLAANKTNVLVIEHEFRHSGAVAFVAWSHDDAKLATCCQDGCVRVFDITGPTPGVAIRLLGHHIEPVTCCSWLPDKHGNKKGHIVTGSHDKHIYMVDCEGDFGCVWETQRVQDLVVVKNRYIIAATNERFIRIFDLHTNKQLSLPQADTVLSISLSPSERYLVTTLSNHSQYIWDLGDDKDGALHMPTIPHSKLAEPCTHVGHSKFVLRACIGGLDEKFVASGSEEGNVYIWHRASGKLLVTLKGHQGVVNAVCWNPVNHGMLVSVSDDGTVKVWEPAVLLSSGDGSGGGNDGNV